MQLMATSAMLIHTPSGNRNAELVNTHINIRLFEKLLVQWQWIRAETIDRNTIFFSRKSRLHAKI